MKKSLLVIVVVFLASLSGAQEAGLTTPVARSSEAKYKIRDFNVSNPPTGTANASMTLSVQDSSNTEIRTQSVSIPDPAHAGATVPGLCTAMITVRSGETGTDARKLQFRVLGYLSDQGYLPPSTLTP